ncbi:MAG TPA: hypothetical protein VNN19_00360 [bacterium]|nr:hypothetical protein [bacterium]
MRRRGPRLWLWALMVLLLTPAAMGGAPTVVITPGVGIGPITIGMPVANVAPTLGLETTPRLSGNRVRYDYARLGLSVWAADGQVVRVATRNPLHRTATGVHPGQLWSDGLLSVCRGAAYTVEIERGYEVSCPFVGIAFEVTGQTLGAIAVFKPAAR